MSKMAVCYYAGQYVFFAGIFTFLVCLRFNKLKFFFKNLNRKLSKKRKNYNIKHILPNDNTMMIEYINLFNST